jgi:predicted SprT family Zn-dependent metalloprotease
MDLNAVQALTEKKMAEHGLSYRGWRFKWLRAKHTFGVCDYSDRFICISQPLSQINDEEAVTQTILHEIAHALVGPGHGHDKVWKEKCRQIGAKPRRCFSNNDTKVFERKKLSVARINGVSYKEGDPIALRTSNGLERCKFIMFMPRSYKYPIVAEIPSGERYRFTENHVY